MRRMFGFTLIELMITVAIISILTIIALPSYKSYIQRGIRSQGQQFLMDLAQRQEQYFLDQRAYATVLGTGTGGLSMTMPTDVASKYQPPVITPTAGPPAGFTISMAPITPGTMSGDGCLVINNLQQRWRETDCNGVFGANDCRWEDSRCTPS